MEQLYGVSYTFRVGQSVRHGVGTLGHGHEERCRTGGGCTEPAASRGGECRVGSLAAELGVDKEFYLYIMTADINPNILRVVPLSRVCVM